MCSTVSRARLLIIECVPESGGEVASSSVSEPAMKKHRSGERPPAVENSGEEPSAGEVRLKTRARVFAEVLESAEPSEMTVFGRILYYKRKHIDYTEDGYVRSTPSTMQEVHQAVGVVLDVLQSALEYAGVSEGPLGEDEQKTAYEWLKDEWLRKWCDNDKLIRDVGMLKDGVIKNRQEKQKIRQRKHGAFNAFLKEFVGNSNVARIMLNHGFTTASEFRNLLQAMGDFRTSQEYRTRLLEEEQCASQQAKLRAQAHAARKAHRDGRRIEKKISTGEWNVKHLNQYQREVLGKYQDGSTGVTMRAANLAFGYGLGSQQQPSIQERIYLEYASRGDPSSF